jgi:hypothetical protein
MSRDAKEINAALDKELERQLEILQHKGIAVLNEEVWAVLGAFLVVHCRLGGSQAVELSAIHLEKVIDAARNGLVT